jgi:hypothetical protein
MDLIYVRPDEMQTLYGTVATTAGATDSDYLDEWICDGRAGRPARATSGTVTWSITNPSMEVGLVAVCHCNADVNATIGGGVSGTVIAGALQANGIRLNGFLAVAPTAITNLTVAFSGAASAVVLGEIIAGKRRTLTRPVYTEDETTVDDFTRTVDVDLASIPPYDAGLEGRTWSGSFVVDSTERDNILAWFRAQRAGTRPSLVIPIETVNDAWVCFLRRPTFRPVSGRHWSVSLTIDEVPRVRW